LPAWRALVPFALSPLADLTTCERRNPDGARMPPTHQPAELGLNCREFPPMHKIPEYKQHAEECRRMAVRMKDPKQRKQLEDMAEAWEMLAQERAKQIDRTNNRRNN
jgi:hypothetical protein